MLITNKTYSNVILYADELNGYLESGKEIKTDCKCLDKEKNNFVFFWCFDFTTDIFIKNNLFFKEIKYCGSLKFCFNKATNEVCVEELPYIEFNNIRIYVFTSDIASIVVDKLKSYIEAKDIKIKFLNGLSFIAMDEKVISLIPSIKDTKNYIFFEKAKSQIKKEEAKVMGETLRYKERTKKEEKRRERAIARKKVVYGIDPQSFRTQEEFYDKLTEILVEIWTRKINNIERHLKANEEQYKNKLLQYVLNRENHYGIESLLRNCLLDMLKKKGVSNIGGYKIEDFYVDYKFSYNEYTFKKFIESSTVVTPEMREIEKIRDYFYNVNDFSWSKDKIDKQIAKKAVDILLYNDLYSKNGVIDIFNYVVKEILPLSDLKLRKYGEIEQLFGWEIYYYFIEFFTLAEKHPVFKEYYKLFEQYDVDYFCRNHIRIPSLDLLVQIHRLREQLKCYKNRVENPKNATVTFFKNSKIWGSIMQIPIWKRFYRDGYSSDELKERFYHGDHSISSIEAKFPRRHEFFNLLMIKPGVKSIDYGNIVSFLDYKDFNRKSGKRRREINERFSNIRKVTNNYEESNRFMVMVPNSLSLGDIIKLIDYAYKRGEKLNFVCESVETAILVKKVLIRKAIEYEKRGQKYFKDWTFVNVDPGYYDTFFAETPNNKDFWHKYDFSSTYKYRRKELLSLDRQFEIALALVQEKYNGDYRILEEMLLGTYSSQVLPHINEFNQLIFEESRIYEEELKISLEKKEAELKIKQEKKLTRKKRKNLKKTGNDEDGFLPF